VTIRQDASLYTALVDGAEAVELAQQPGRRAYVHVVRGSVAVTGERLEGGDAIKLSGESAVQLSQGRDAEVLLFDLA
jgi:redox-sensitive bicupin YhaK (pirin superfamily)